MSMEVETGERRELLETKQELFVFEFGTFSGFPIHTSRATGDDVIKNEHRDADIIAEIIPLQETDKYIEIAIRVEKILTQGAFVIIRFHQPMLCFYRAVIRPFRLRIDMDNGMLRKSTRKITIAGPRERRKLLSFRKMLTGSC